MADNLYLPQVDYTSRDYASIRQDLINLIPNFAPQWTSRDASDFGVVLLELFSYMGDLLNYYIDRAANESFITTSTQRDTVLNIAKLLNYTPNDPVPATGSVTLTNSTTSPVVVPALTQVATAPDGTNSQLIFETNSTITLAASGASSVNITQGASVLSEQVGTSDGTPNQALKISKTGVITSAISVSVNGVTYSKAASLIDFGATDPVFQTYTKADGYTYIQFGDGVSGRIPPSGAVIYVSYRVGDGSAGNVGAGSINTMLKTSAGTTISGVTVSQTVATSGGTDAESTDSIRINAPLSLRTLNRAVSLKDYGQLAVQVPGVAKATASSSAYTVVSLYIAASGGAAASSTLTDSVSAYLLDKTPPNTTVSVFDYTAAYPYLSVSVNVKPQYNASVVGSNVKNAIYTLLAFDNVFFNDLITQLDIYSTISAVEGVSYATISIFEKTSAATGYVPGATISDFSCNVNEIPILNKDYIVVSTVGGTN